MPTPNPDGHLTAAEVSLGRNLATLLWMLAAAQFSVMLNWVL